MFRSGAFPSSIETSGSSALFLWETSQPTERPERLMRFGTSPRPRSRIAELNPEAYNSRPCGSECEVGRRREEDGRPSGQSPVVLSRERRRSGAAVPRALARPDQLLRTPALAFGPLANGFVSRRHFGHDDASYLARSSDNHCFALRRRNGTPERAFPSRLAADLCRLRATPAGEQAAHGLREHRLDFPHLALRHMPVEHPEYGTGTILGIHRANRSDTLRHLLKERLS